MRSIKSFKWCHFIWPWTNLPLFSRSRHSLMLNISQTATDTAIVTIEGEQETAPKLSNGTNFNDLEWPLTPISRSRYYSTSNNSKTVQDLYLRTNRKLDMVYRTAPFSMTLTPNPRVRFRVSVGKGRKPYPNFQMIPLLMTLSDLWPTF